MKDNHVLYFGIKNSSEMRRELLRGAKQTITLLKKFEQFNALRKEKEVCILQLRSVSAGLSSLSKKLRAVLPKPSMKLDILPKELRTSETKAPQEIKKTVPEQHTKKTRIEFLEEELSKIESRLGNV